jgi:hypothetical protein
MQKWNFQIYYLQKSQKNKVVVLLVFVVLLVYLCGVNVQIRKAND